MVWPMMPDQTGTKGQTKQLFCPQVGKD